MHCKTRENWPFSGIFFDFRVILTSGSYLPKIAFKDSKGFESSSGIPPPKKTRKGQGSVVRVSPECECQKRIRTLRGHSRSGHFKLRDLSQDTFDHDKGQKSAISEKFLHWIFLNFLQWIFPLFSRFTVQFSKEVAPKCGESRVISRRRKKRRILSRLWLSWFFRSRLRGSCVAGRGVSHVK